MQWKKGTEYICVLSKSPGYKVGKSYKPYLNEKGTLVLKGDDGFEDPVGMLRSAFREARD